MPFLNQDRKPIIHHPEGYPLEVIATFKPDGDFIPLYFRLEDDMQERFTYKIGAIQSIKDKHDIKVFHCIYITHGFRNLVTLVFDIAQCRWVIG